jgi:vancomycin resistance protein VanJ
MTTRLTPTRIGGWLMAGAAWLIVVVGVLLHLMVQDRWPMPWCLLYYGLPRPVLCGISGIGLIAIARSERQGWSRRMAWGVFLAMLGWVAWGDVGWRLVWTAPARDSATLRVALWNTCHLPRGIEGAVANIARFDADLIGLVEAGETTPADLARWRDALEAHGLDYEVASTRPGMLWLSRRPAKIGEPIDLGITSDAVPLEFTHAGRSCRAVLVDIAARVDVPRHPSFAKLAAQRDAWRDKPLIVLGDFNTPPESTAFDHFKEWLKPTVTAQSAGYRPTWPVPFPVLTLDQIWVSAEWTPVTGRTGWSWSSDHRPVLVDLRIATTGPNPQDRSKSIEVP